MKKTFAYHIPSEASGETIAKLRKLFSDMNDEIEKVCPVSRERAVALTHLETTAMWAIKSIVCNDPESKVVE